MNVVDQVLIEKIRQLPPQQFAVIEDFVEFLADKASKRAALDHLLSVAPAMEAAGITPLTEEEIAAEIQACRKPLP